MTGRRHRRRLVRDWVCALAEYDCLWSHRRGEDVAALVAVLDGIAGSSPGDQGLPT